MRRIGSGVLVLLLAGAAACSGSTTDDVAPSTSQIETTVPASTAPDESRADPSEPDGPVLPIGRDEEATPALTSTSTGASASSTTTTTTAPPSSEPTASTTATPPTTATAPTTAATTPFTSDSSNPIAVPVELLAEVTPSGPSRCKWVDLRSVPVPPNPGYTSETLESQTLSGDDHWALAFYLMLYANCERQARGVAPTTMYAAETQVALQQTVLGISESHGRFVDRADIAGGLAAEGHGGGPRPGEPIEHDGSEDDNGDGLWSASEIARRSVSGNQSNDNAGLVTHGGAMTDARYTCIFTAASLGQSVDHRVDVIIFYGNRC